MFKKLKKQTIIDIITLIGYIICALFVIMFIKNIELAFFIGTLAGVIQSWLWGLSKE